MAGLRVDGDRDVVGRDALVDADSGVEALDRRQAAVEARGFVLGSQVVVDRGRLGAVVGQRFDRGAPLLDAGRLLLGRRLGESNGFDRGAEVPELGQLRGVALEQTGLAEREPVVTLGVGAHPEQASDLAGTVAEAVESNQILESVHGDRAHLDRIAAASRATLRATRLCRFERSVLPS
jgi:hypothetical protein